MKKLFVLIISITFLFNFPTYAGTDDLFTPNINEGAVGSYDDLFTPDINEGSISDW